MPLDQCVLKLAERRLREARPFLSHVYYHKTEPSLAAFPAKSCQEPVFVGTSPTLTINSFLSVANWSLQAS